MRHVKLPAELLKRRRREPPPKRRKPSGEVGRRTSALPSVKLRLGMVIGPILTFEAAKLIGTIWGIKGKGSIPRSALGEVLAEQYRLGLYADLCVIFEGDDFEHHVLRQTEAGELWLVRKDRLDKFASAAK